MTQTLPPGKQLRGLSRCWCGYWMQPLLRRAETLETTLGLFDREEELHSNAAVFFRTAHVYAPDRAALEVVCGLLKTDPEIASAEVLHERSDVGLPWQVVAIDRAGREIRYDGVLFRITEAVTPADMDLSEVGATPGWPGHCFGIVRPLGKALAQRLPRFDDIGVRSLGFYVVEQVDFDSIGLTSGGTDAQLRLSCIDPGIHTIAALTEHSSGRRYEICIGRRDDALAMMVNAMAHQHEVDTLIEHMRARRKEAVQAGLAVTTSYGRLVSGGWHLRARLHAWRELKSAVRRLVQLRTEAGLLDLARLGLEQTVDGRLTATPAPVQMWSLSKPPDSQQGIQRERPFFQSARLQDGKIVDVSERATEPPYASSVAALATKLRLLQESIRDHIDEGRSTVAAFQTEFGLYAVVFAALGVLVAIIISLIPLLVRRKV